MRERSLLCIVLAAGEGTRMMSATPKVLHPIGHRSMIGHVLSSVGLAGAAHVAVVVGPGQADRSGPTVGAEVARLNPQAEVYVQTDRLGTAHAVLQARSLLENPDDDVVIIFGDTPLIRPETIAALRTPLAEGAAVAVLGFRAANPKGYGRLLERNGQLIAIREENDASETEKAVNLCNAGLMALAGSHAIALLDAIGNVNAKGEYYLTDAVELANSRGLSAIAIETSEDEVRGVNTRAQLAEAEAVFQSRMRARAMAGGATLLAPETVYFSADTTLGRDVVIEPNVVFGPGVAVADNVTIRAFSHLEGAQVSEGATLGPYARLRPGARIGEGAHIGNFVEIKQANVEKGAKVNHLTYIGDARVGAGANIGAGTITCNYDGFLKHHTDIGSGAFVGSNSSLVAPVKIGDGAYIGSGSVITTDVPADALAVSRPKQSNLEGYGARLRRKLAAAKAAKQK